MQYLTALLIVAQSIFAYSQPQVLYKSPLMSQRDYEALKIANPELMSFDQYQLQNNVSHLLLSNLRSAFLQAQQSFLNAEISEMALRWQDVTSFALKADWQAPERNMISFSYLRLAQIAQDAEQTRSFINLAAQFDPNYVADAQLLPPPIVLQYEQATRNLSIEPVYTPAIDGFTIAIINGLPQNINKKLTLKLSDGMKRITLLSPTYSPITRIISANDLPKLKLHKQLLDIIADAKLKIPKPAISNSVIEASDKTNTDETPSITAQANLGLNSERKFYQTRNFWVGAAVTVVSAIAIAIYANENSEKEHQPTHREGL